MQKNVEIPSQAAKKEEIHRLVQMLNFTQRVKRKSESGLMFHSLSSGYQLAITFEPLAQTWPDKMRTLIAK